MVDAILDNGIITISDGLYSVQLNEGLTDEEVEDALDILRWIQGENAFYGIAGLMLVTGAPRSGKGIFTNTFSWKIKRYFKDIRIVRDDHPTALYGNYEFFNEDRLSNDLKVMFDVATDGKAAKKKPKFTSAQCEQWATEEGSSIMQKSVALFDEYWKYMYNRTPHSIMNKSLGGLNKMWGHTETLHIGVVQWVHDLDRFTCLPWVTHEVRCQMSSERAGTVEAHMYHVKFNRRKMQLVLLDQKPVRIVIDGLKERPELGVSYIDDDGNVHYYRYVDLFYSKSAPMIDFMRHTKRWE